MGGCGFLLFFLEKQFFIISRFMLFSTLKYIEKCPFTYWLNGRWFLQIVERDSWNLYPLYPLFPCSDFVSQMWGGGCNVFLTFYAISNIFYLPRCRRPGTGDIAMPPVRPSVCPSVCLSCLSVCLSVRHV